MYLWGATVQLTALGYGNGQSLGNSLEVQWLGLSIFTARAQVQSLVRKLRSCKP